MGEPEPERKRYPRRCWRKIAMFTCPDPATIVEGLFDL
jgi:predicted metalloenzyme YecM